MQNNLLDNLLENILCPICYLAMVPPQRTPIVIPGCGHTICETCISKIQQCPLCHQRISNPTKNVLVLQIIDYLNQNHLIPPDINPPLPSDNKLIPKIEPICTFAATGQNYIIQKWYQCRTCKIGGNFGFCEICLKKCHKNHDTYLHSATRRFYCDCPSKCRCQSIQKEKNPKCSYDLTYGFLGDQPMYQCDDCHITGDFYICQNCAINCHNGHKLHYCGIVKKKVCHCFEFSVCKITNRKPICTYVRSGQNYTIQPWFHCKTCGLVGNNGCCAACAHNCHKGHDVEFYCFAGLNGNPKFYCDCGDGYNNVKCSIASARSDCRKEYLNTCPNFEFQNKEKKVKQRKYHCLTCGVFGSLGICEGCAINCHINHSIEYVGVENFCCTCQTTEKCMMEMRPSIHNNRNVCDRKVLSKDDVSACYTCYSCDKSGNVKICETCALKNHLSHDVHLVGYFKFDCHG